MSRAAIADALARAGDADVASRWLIDWLDETDSTQRVAATIGARVGPLRGRWLLVATARQEAGRGRGGARWEAAAGEAVLVTLAAELDAPGEQWPLASLVVGAALADAIAARTGTDVRWKWPNDLLVVHEGRWRKLAGCLAERVERPGLSPLWLIGIGLNRDTDGLPEALRRHTVGLRALGPHDASTLESLVAEVAGVVRDAVTAWRASNWRFDPDVHTERLAFRGAHIRCDLGGSEREGVLVGLHVDGALLLADTADGVPRPCLPLAIVGADVEPPWHPPARLRPDPGSGGS
ncbi:MAG: hypothetical protein RIT45_43 [Pseudomonadota bacterium]